jgi:uncharacterized membrane protein (UPF0127 family)
MRLSSVLIILGSMLIMGALLSGCRRQISQTGTDSASGLSTLQIGDKSYRVELATTPEQQQKGLSGRDEIGSDGMLFIFTPPRQPAFWMIDMKFDLDFIWIKDGVVSEVMTNIPKPLEGQAPADLPRYTPQQPVDMMLEVNAGFAAREGISVGDQVHLTSN